MEFTWIVLGIILVLLVALAYYVPSVRNAIANIIVLYLRKNEGTLVMIVYNNLPPQIKSFIPSSNVAQIVSIVIEFGIRLLIKK